MGILARPECAEQRSRMGEILPFPAVHPAFSVPPLFEPGCDGAYDSGVILSRRATSVMPFTFRAALMIFCR